MLHNCLIEFNSNNIIYDADGNMLSDGLEDFTYDSSNRLIVAKGHSYTYNAENVRIRNLCEEEDTIYTYDTNCKLSKLLCKTTNGVTTKYVYGRGLIGEETNNVFKTYHFDNRGSTVAITNFDGGITDTFTYDTYGKCINRTGTSSVIFGYNGRDGVVTDSNGLIYMRARYYAPYMKRFVNADIIAGDISNAVTLNRFAYANGNPVSFVDPFGLSAKSMYSESGMLYRNSSEAILLEPKHHLFVAPFSDQAAADEYFALKFEEYNAIISESSKRSSTSNNESTLNADNKVAEISAVPIVSSDDLFGGTIDWMQDAGAWINKNLKNKDGTYSLYDNQRFKNSFFHEQILVVDPSLPSLNFSKDNFSIGLGSVSVDAMTGGWEGKYVNLSLLDFGHAEAGLEYKDGDFNVGAMASIWSPSFSIKIFGRTIEISTEVGSIGASTSGEFSAGNNKVEVGVAIGFGVTISYSW